jgi:hypothetical protein
MKKPNKKRFDRQKPSQIVKHELLKFEEEAIETVCKALEIDSKVAKDLLYKEGVFQELLKVKDKQFRIEMMTELYPILKDQVKVKTNKGSMAQAKETIVAMGILKDKIMGHDKYSSPIQVGAKNVQINLDWTPKWLKGKKK